MSARFAWFAGGSLFAVAVVFAVAGLWLPAGLAAAGCMYVCGRCDRDRDRLVAFAVLREERDRAVAEADRLHDELIYRYDCQHVGRFLDDCGLPDRPGLRVRPDWAAVDRKPNATTLRGASPSRVSNP